MEQIRIESGIKEIALQNEKEEVFGVIRVNTSDANTAVRFANLIQNLNHVSDEFQKEAERLKEKYEGTEDTDVEKIVDYSNTSVNFLTRCADEIDAVFGAGTIRTVFSECYEINPDFVPSEDALVRFVDGIIPVMNKLYSARFEENKKRYGAAKRGKNTK